LKLQFGQRNIFLVEKQLIKELFVMMINIGGEGTEVRKKAQKEITQEIIVWTGIRFKAKIPKFLEKILVHLILFSFLFLFRE
jgi:hypothetical protein